MLNLLGISEHHTHHVDGLKTERFRGDDDSRAGIE
jgi:hypothetical protein